MSTTDRDAAISAAPPAGPRLLLQSDQSGAVLLDGGWWPRSADPAAELPGLIRALDKRHGRIITVMVGTAGWDASRPRRVRVDGPAGSRVVRIGWFATMPAGLLTAISASGQRTDLVTIPARQRTRRPGGDGTGSPSREPRSRPRHPGRAPRSSQPPARS